MAAARRLLGCHPLHDVGLNAIAREAGLTKPNLYRYFESREEVLLALFLEELRAFTTEVVAGLSEVLPAAPGAEAAAASVLVDAYARRPLLCRLLGAIASVLEHNVSTGTIGATKKPTMAMAVEVAHALQRSLPQLPPERCLWLNNMIALLVAGLWPPAHPAPAVTEALARPDFAALRPDFARDLHEAIITLIRGS